MFHYERRNFGTESHLPHEILEGAVTDFQQGKCRRFGISHLSAADRMLETDVSGTGSLFRVWSQSSHRSACSLKGITFLPTTTLPSCDLSTGCPVDQNGNIVMHVEGEGNNRPIEEKIRELLAKAHPEVMKIALEPPDNTFAPEYGVPTQEIYVGNWFGRGALEDPQGYSEGDVVNFKDAKEPDDGGVVLRGRWETGHDGVTSADKKQPVEAVLRYHARAVYSVMSLDNVKKPVRVYVLQDGQPLDKDNAGKDVQFDAHGSFIDVSEARMYYLVQNPAFAPHILSLEPHGPGFTLHSFTYGNNCQLDFNEQ